MKPVRKNDAAIQFGAGLSGYVAEVGAGLCCADLGLPNVLHDSHASYVGHWLGILRGDQTAIIHAAAKAEQAFAYLQSFGGVAVDNACDDAAVPVPTLAA